MKEASFLYKIGCTIQLKAKWKSGNTGISLDMSSLLGTRKNEKQKVCGVEREMLLFILELIVHIQINFEARWNFKW